MGLVSDYISMDYEPLGPVVQVCCAIEALEEALQLMQNDQHTLAASKIGREVFRLQGQLGPIERISGDGLFRPTNEDRVDVVRGERLSTPTTKDDAS